MNNKTPNHSRNPQDIIYDTYNKRDYEIVEKNMNPYVMPLDMVRDVDVTDSKHFYPSNLVNTLYEEYENSTKK